MFRHNPLGYLLCIALTLLGVGPVILFAWWIKARNTTLKVTEDRTVLQSGIWSKNAKEIYHKDIRNVRIQQSFTQHIFNTGTVSITSLSKGLAEIEVSGMPHAEELKALLDQNRRVQQGIPH